MKKTIALFLALLMAVTLVACGTPSDGDDTQESPQADIGTENTGEPQGGGNGGGNGNGTNGSGNPPTFQATSVIDVLENICVSFDAASVSLATSQSEIVENYVSENTPSTQPLSRRSAAPSVTLLADKEGGDGGGSTVTYGIIDDMEGIYLLSLLRWYNDMYFAPIVYKELEGGEQYMYSGGQMSRNVLKFKEIDALLAEGEENARLELPSNTHPELITYYRKEGDKYIVGEPISSTQFAELSDQYGKDKLVGFVERSYSIEDGALVVAKHDVVILDAYKNEEVFTTVDVDYLFGNEKIKFMTTDTTSSVEYWGINMQDRTEYLIWYMTVVEGEESYYLQTYGLSYDEPSIFSFYLIGEDDTNEELEVKDQMVQDFQEMFDRNGGHSWCMNLYLQAEIAKVGTNGTFRFFRNFLDDTMVGLDNVPENWIYQTDFDTATVLTSIEVYNTVQGKVYYLMQFNYAGLIIDEHENK